MARLRSPAALPLVYAFALFSLALAAQGCGKPNAAPIEPPFPATIPARTLTEAQKLARDSRISCRDSGKCPEALALLTNATAHDVGLCTSFLIGPDLIATNSHCIPEDLKSAGSDCTDRIWVRFAAVPGHPDEQVRCRSVLGASVKDIVNSPDYAFFRLEHAVSRQPITLNRQGLANGATYTVNKVNPMSRTAAVGEVEQIHCKTPHRTYITPDFDSDFAGTGTIADCVVIHGNSGSPVIDDAGRVRAIVHATIEADRFRHEITQEQFPMEEDDFAPMGIATNLACVRFPDDPVSMLLPFDCVFQGSRPRTPDNRLVQQLMGNNLERTLLAEAHGIVADWTTQLNDTTAHIAWTEMSVPVGSDLENSLKTRVNRPNRPAGILTTTPHCFKPNREWSRSGNGTSATLTADLPTWNLSAGLNRYAQLGFHYRRSEQPLHVELTYNPTQLRQSLPTTVVMRVNDATLPAATLFDGAIPVCPAEPTAARH